MTNSQAGDIKNLVPGDIAEEIEARNFNIRNQNPSASGFLNRVNSITKNIPHTNKAAQEARCKAMSMVTSLGFPDFFVSVSPPEDNSFLMCIYSGINTADLAQDLDDITEEQLRELSKEREKIKLNCPGLCAFNFETIKRIVLKEVVGWKNNGKGGLFGVPKAYFYAVEEQGRGALHIHLLIWIHGLTYDREALSQKNVIPKSTWMLNQQNCAKCFDKVGSTELAGNSSLNPPGRGEKFPHSCENPGKRKKHSTVQVADDQHLRNIRHRDFSKQENGSIAHCTKCNHKFSSEALGHSFLQGNTDVDLSRFADDQR